MRRLNRISTLMLGLIMACLVYSNVAVAIDLNTIFRDITKEKISHPFKQENKKRERTPEERHLSALAKQIIEEDRVPDELKEKWRHKYRKIPKTHGTHRKGRIISNKSLEIPSYSRALIKLRTYCLDSSLPAPGFREKMYIVHISKLLIRELIPIYERLMNYSALHPEKKLQIQRIAWFMRHLSEGIYVPSFDLVNEDKALLEQIYPGSTGIIEDQKRKILVKRKISKWVDALADKTIPPEIRGVLRDLSNSGYNVNTPPGDLRTANSIASRVLHIINTTKPVGEMEDNSEYTLLSNDIAVKTEHSGGYGGTALRVVNPTPVVKTLDFTEYALQSTRPTQRLGMGGIESVEWEKGKPTKEAQPSIVTAPEKGAQIFPLPPEKPEHAGSTAPVLSTEDPISELFEMIKKGNPPPKLFINAFIYLEKVGKYEGIQNLEIRKYLIKEAGEDFVKDRVASILIVFIVDRMKEEGLLKKFSIDEYVMEEILVTCKNLATASFSGQIIDTTFILAASLTDTIEAIKNLPPKEELPPGEYERVKGLYKVKEMILKMGVSPKLTSSLNDRRLINPGEMFSISGTGFSRSGEVLIHEKIVYKDEEYPSSSKINTDRYGRFLKWITATEGPVLTVFRTKPISMTWQIWAVDVKTGEESNKIFFNVLVNLAPQHEDLLKQPSEEIENLKDNKNKNTEDLLK